MSITPTAACPFNGMSGIYQNMLIQIADTGGTRRPLFSRRPRRRFITLPGSHNASSVTLHGRRGFQRAAVTEFVPGGGDSPRNFTVTRSRSARAPAGRPEQTRGTADAIYAGCVKRFPAVRRSIPMTRLGDRQPAFLMAFVSPLLSIYQIRPHHPNEEEAGTAAKLPQSKSVRRRAYGSQPPLYLPRLRLR
jgi:hypothetical protein